MRDHGRDRGRCRGLQLRRAAQGALALLRDVGGVAVPGGAAIGQGLGDRLTRQPAQALGGVDDAVLVLHGLALVLQRGFDQTGDRVQVIGVDALVVRGPVQGGAGRVDFVELRGAGAGVKQLRLALGGQQHLVDGTGYVIQAAQQNIAFAQAAFDVLAGADVVQDRHGLAGLALGVAQHRDVPLDPDDLAVLLQAALLESKGWQVAILQAAPMVEFGRQVARVGQGMATGADEGVACVAQQEAGFVVDGLDVALRREQQLPAGTVFKDGFPQRSRRRFGMCPEGLAGIVRERGRLAGHGAKPQHLTHTKIVASCNTSWVCKRH